MASTNNTRRPAAPSAEAQGHASVKTSSTFKGAVTGGGDEAEDNDSSADEAADDETSEVALLGADTSEQHLAGLDDDEDDEMFMSDAEDAVLGAAQSDVDDDDYTGAAELSDEDDIADEHDDRAVRRALEQDLKAEFVPWEQSRNTASISASMDAMFLQEDQRLANELGLGGGHSANDLSLDFDVNMNDDPFVGLAPSDSLYRDMYDDANREYLLTQADNPLARHNSEESTETKKRVRFAEPQEMRSRSASASSADEQDPNDIFPDLFDVQDDPALRQQFGLDVNVDASFQFDFNDDAGSVYDFDGDEERIALALDDDESDSDQLSSNYDSDSEDGGDTTDEETEDQIATRLKMIRERRALEARNTTPSTPTTAKRPTVTSARSTGSPATPRTGPGRGPKIGKFAIDKTKAIMTADSTGKCMTVRPPSQPSERDKEFWKRHQSATAASSRSSTPRSSIQHMRTPSKKNSKLRPFTAQSTLGTMFDGNLDILHNNSDLSVQSSFAPVLSARPRSSYASTFTGSSDTEVDDQVDLSEFIDLDESSSDNEEPQSATTITSPGSEMLDSISSLDTRTNESLFDHLSQQRGLVGSFRNNQNFTKHASSLALHPAKRASTMETNALLKGRRSAANIPITPLRKKRVSQDLTSTTGAGIRKNVGSPLSARRPRSRGGSLSAGLQQTLGPSLM
ncbi:hypothetical protein LTR62_001295 [Meristemomyces frigidus]|uniref:Uncharacterized protein n=1 Tax=Meristemomyces frigidus TaxID=1508187 RepID=A0AAN7T962_9PEZI|nr:hypothetical protein LTR62_001295 [Meristemomyces frigidus]